MFDVPFKVGREARIRLAETIMERNDRGCVPGSGNVISPGDWGANTARNPNRAAGRLAVLAKLEETKGSNDSMRLAAAYYREFARDFANIAGAGQANRARTCQRTCDRQTLPAAIWKKRTNPWGPVKIGRASCPGDSFKLHLMEFVMQPEGDQTPFARQHRLMLDLARTRPTRACG